MIIHITCLNKNCLTVKNQQKYTACMLVTMMMIMRGRKMSIIAESCRETVLNYDK